MAKIKLKKKHTQALTRICINENPPHGWWDCKMVQTCWKSICNIFFHKMLHTDKYSRELKTYGHLQTCTGIFLVALFLLIKHWKRSKCPSTDEWINEYGIVI